MKLGLTFSHDLFRLGLIFSSYHYADIMKFSIGCYLAFKTWPLSFTFNTDCTCQNPIVYANELLNWRALFVTHCCVHEAAGIIMAVTAAKFIQEWRSNYNYSHEITMIYTDSSVHLILI